MGQKICDGCEGEACGEVEVCGFVQTGQEAVAICTIVLPGDKGGEGEIGFVEEKAAMHLACNTYRADAAAKIGGQGGNSNADGFEDAVGVLFSNVRCAGRQTGFMRDAGVGEWFARRVDHRGGGSGGAYVDTEC